MERFLTAISDAYWDFDEQRELLELSLENVSSELNASNNQLKGQVVELEQTQRDLMGSMGILNGILESTGEAIFAFDSHNHLLRMNQSATDFIHSLPSKNQQSKDTGAVLDFVLRHSKDYEKNVQQLKSDSQARLSGVLALQDERVYEFFSTPLYTNSVVSGRVWSLRNITRQKQDEALIKHQAFHDALTGLPNRVLVLDRIEHAAEFSRRLDIRLAVLFIDLDHFKKINDTMGHQVGDQLLMYVASRISQCMRSHDTLARFGGDEFVVLLEKLHSHQVAASICARIISAIKEPFLVDGQQFHISASIGISVYPEDSTEPNELIRKADLAMYHAKEKGRGTFEFFNESLERFAQYQLELENKLRDAMELQALTVFFQPKITVSSGQIESVEALLRWFPEDASPISPSAFVPVAERAGLLPQLDRWVLLQACKQIRYWQSQGIYLSVSVNLSTQQFNDKLFVNYIRSTLMDTGVSGEYIELEITESMLMENFDQARDYLLALRESGIKVSIDDFGTGYSSLHYLQRLPIDIIKIDRSFVQKLEDNPEEKTIVDAIISLSHSLNLKVVAEGVEKEISYHYLRDRDCDYIQGYYFYKPMHPNDLTQLLLEQKNNTSS